MHAVLLRERENHDVPVMEKVFGSELDEEESSAVTDQEVQELQSQLADLWLLMLETFDDQAHSLLCAKNINTKVCARNELLLIVIQPHCQHVKVLDIGEDQVDVRNSVDYGLQIAGLYLW